MGCNSRYAPVALFVYNRPDHTSETLKNLQGCKEFDETPVFIFCDGPKSLSDADSVDSTREVVRQLAGENVTVVEHEKNQGLANSIIQGVSKLCDDYGRVIVVEDDLLVSNRFLEYMNDSLARYEDDAAIMQISAYIFDVPEFTGREETLFLPFTTSWGWATWSRAWDCFDAHADGWEMLENQQLRDKFNLDGSFDYYAMLKNQMKGLSDSWAIRWYWSVFKNNGLVLYPPKTYVDNIGFDGSGTHGWRSAESLMPEARAWTGRCTYPDTIQVDEAQFAAIKKVMRKLNPGLLAYLRIMMKKILARF